MLCAANDVVMDILVAQWVGHQTWWSRGHLLVRMCLHNNCASFDTRLHPCEKELGSRYLFTWLCCLIEPLCSRWTTIFGLIYICCTGCSETKRCWYACVTLALRSHVFRWFSQTLSVAWKGSSTPYQHVPSQKPLLKVCQLWLLLMSYLHTQGFWVFSYCLNIWQKCATSNVATSWF